MKAFGHLLLSLVLLIALQTSPAADTGLPKTLRVGTSAGYAPLTFKKEGVLTGMEIDLANAVGKQLDVTVQFVELPFEGLIPALTEGKIDVIMSGMSVTDERSRQVLFTDPYMQVGQMGLIRVADLAEWSRPNALYNDDNVLKPGDRVRPGALRDHLSDPAEWSRLGALNDKVIGVKQGTTGDRFVSKEFPQGNIKRFDSIEAGVEALRAKNIDIFIHDAPTIWRLSAQYDTWDSGIMGLFRPLTDEELAWAVRPGNTQLAGALNKALDAIKKDGSLETIKKHWIPVQVTVGDAPE
jgi:polar amino acid transport system substrate-binding protein